MSSLLPHRKRDPGDARAPDRRVPILPALPKHTHAPLWINRRSTQYLIATCTECLRSFPIENDLPETHELQTAECPSCGTTITYAVDNTVLEMLAANKPILTTAEAPLK